jgi:hypothetical protein
MAVVKADWQKWRAHDHPIGITDTNGCKKAFVGSFSPLIALKPKYRFGTTGREKYLCSWGGNFM